MKTLSRNLCATLFGLCLIVQTLFAQERRYFPEFRIEGGAFVSSKEFDRNPSTGQNNFLSIREGGIESGINCRIARYHFVSVWGDVGFFGLSMIPVSQLKFGVTFLYGDMTTGFAAGPVLAFGGLGNMIGIQACFRKFYLKCLVGRNKSDYSNRLLYAYSASVGYTFDVWLRSR